MSARLHRGETNCVQVLMHAGCRQAVRIGERIPAYDWQQLGQHIPWLQRHTHCGICQGELSPGDGLTLVIHAESGIIWSYQ